ERAGIEHQVAVRLDVDNNAAFALMGERHAKRNADLGGGAELNAGMAIRAVEVPQLADLLLEIIGREHPVLVLDHLPDLKREPGEGDGRRIPVPARLLLPFRPHLAVAFGDGPLAFGDAVLEARVAGDAFFANAGELRDRKNGVTERAD